MTDAMFDELRRVLQDACGVALDETKRYLIEARLAPVLKRLGLSTIAEFAIQLAASPYGPLRTELIEALVTTESSFFRDHHPWETLAGTVIPELIARRAAERALTFWCAAASTGQEPYSLALLFRERFPEVLRSWKLTILATDVSRGMLERSRSGRYSQLDVNRGLPAPMLVKYFRRDGLQWELAEDVRRMVEFREFNLCRPWPAMPKYDLVLLRNVMIYFTPADKKAVLSRAARVLHPHGYLLLGAAETTLNLNESFERAPELKAGFFEWSEAPRETSSNALRRGIRPSRNGRCRGASGGVGLGECGIDADGAVRRRDRSMERGSTDRLVAVEFGDAK